MTLRVLAAAALAAPLLAQPAAYDLSAPAAIWPLPRELTEISALTDLDADTVACVQDEKGVVFDVDVRTGKLVRRRAFGPPGDYEGLTRVGSELWVLRSDGLLLRLRERDAGLGADLLVSLQTEHRDIEGLCHDPVDGVLLVAPKDPPDGGKAARDRRSIFAVDPATGELRARPVLELSVDRVVAEAAALGLAVPTRTTAKGKERADLKLRLSSLAVHPGDGRYYLLSAADRVLLVVDRAGALRHLHQLDAASLPKAEGITFLPGGEMVLASEGVDGSAAKMVVFAPCAPARHPGSGDEPPHDGR